MNDPRAHAQSAISEDKGESAKCKMVSNRDAEPRNINSNVLDSSVDDSQNLHDDGKWAVDQT